MADFDYDKYLEEMNDFWKKMAKKVSGLTPEDEREIEEYLDKLETETEIEIEPQAEDDILRQLEEELEEEERLKSESQQIEEDSEPQTEDEFVFIENTDEIPSVPNKKPEGILSKFGLRKKGGAKRIQQMKNSELLSELFDAIGIRNHIEEDLASLKRLYKKTEANEDLSDEEKRQIMRKAIKRWSRPRQVNIREYFQLKRVLDLKIELLKKYIREKRGIADEIINRMETINAEAREKARKQLGIPKIGGKTKKGKKSNKRSKYRKTQRKNKQNKKKTTKKQRKPKNKRKTKKN